MNWLKRFFRPSPLELSPSDWLRREDIITIDSNIVIDTSRLGLANPPKVWLPPVPGTGSMLPNFSHEHNNILVRGYNDVDHARLINRLQIGDIAAYRIMDDDDDPSDFSRAHKIWAIHRIVDIDVDDDGEYFIFKGDNNPRADPYLVRKKNILWISIGVIF